MQAGRIEALQRMPIFGGVRADTLASILDTATSHAIGPGGFFFQEGDRADSMFVLESGSVEILRRWQGRDHTLARLAQGDCFGEMAIIDLLPRSASVRALEPCTAIEISSTSLFRLYESDLEQFALVQMNIARELSRRLRASDDRLFRVLIGADCEHFGAT